MAEERKERSFNLPSTQDKETLSLVKGLSTDTNQEFQPEGTYTFALNTVLETDIGEQGSISNEMGNSPCIELEEGFVLVGTGNINSGRVVLISTNGSITHIGIQDKCNYKVLIKTECLNLSTCRHVDIQYKLHNGCDIIIYFTDGFNKYHSINLSDLDRYCKQNYSTTNPNLLNPNIPILGVYGWDCSQFYLSPDYSKPDIYLESITSGGRLAVGAYKIAVRYLDDKYNPTDWLFITNPIYIVDINVSTNIDVITGGVQNRNGDAYDYTNKRINIRIENIDIRYKYLQVAVIAYLQGLDVVTDSRQSEFVTISSSSISYSISDIEKMASISYQEVTGISTKINVVQAHTQHQDRLLLGNISNPDYDWETLQKVANEIKVEFVEISGELANGKVCNYEITDKEILGTDKSYNYGSQILSFDNKTFMRDEVYALGIVFVFKNGFESPVFHIPGRKKIGTPQPNDTSTTLQLDMSIPGYTDIYDATRGRSNWSFEVYNTNSDTEWDTLMYNIGPSNSGTHPMHQFTRTSPLSAYELTTIPRNENIYTNQTGSVYSCEDPQIPRWKHVNTCMGPYDPSKYGSIANSGKHKYIIHAYYLPGYFETDTKYPEVLGCDKKPIFPHDELPDGTFRMHNIRHHRVPDSRRAPIYEPSDLDKQTGNIYPMGVAFSNINIPPHLLSEISHYFFVRSDRAGNKTVLDKGWMNVCDTTISAFPPGELVTGNRNVEANYFFMCPTKKYGYTDLATIGTKHHFMFDVVEYVSPKSIYNQNVKLGFDHFKLENTVCSDRYRILFSNIGSNVDWRFSASVYFNQFLSPKTHSYVSRNNFYMAVNIPVNNTEFAIYDQNNFSIVIPGFQIYNDWRRQNIPIAKLFNQDPKLLDANNISWFTKPYDNINPGGDATTGVINSGSADLIPLTSGTIGSGQQYEFGTNNTVIDQLLVNLKNNSEGLIGGGIPSSNINTYTDAVYFVNKHSPYAYYVALKQSIIPYRKLENIKYVRLTNYNIESYHNSYVVVGGDCFISPFRVLKTYLKSKKVDNFNYDKYVGTLLIGFVESEINCNYRHKVAGDDYYAHPFDSTYRVVKDQLQEFCDETRERLEQLYHYNLDFSTDNKDRLYRSLPDFYEYCSSCKEEFPGTVYYSNVSLPEQVFDNYRVFNANDQLEVSGTITNMFVKQDNLFIHTSSNLYRVLTGTQEIQTTTDTISVGANSLGSARIQKVFDNALGIRRGGCQFKAASVYCEDAYIWVDMYSKKVFGISDSPRDLTLAGMNRFFYNNMDLVLKKQFEEDYYSLYGEFKEYPYLGTTCSKSVGYNATYDPVFKRYILHKKDYELLSDFRSNLDINPVMPYPENQVYLLEDGYYLAIAPDKLQYMDPEHSTFFSNKSWTISFSLQRQGWISFHSYRPNMMYYTDNNFYSYIISNKNIWLHNTYNYTTYYGNKYDHIIEYVYRSVYPEFTYDQFEYVSNVFKYIPENNSYAEIQESTYDRFYVYNNNQISNLRTIQPGNLNPYSRISYDPNISQAYKMRNIWRISRFRDYAVDRNNNNNSMFTNNWLTSNIGTYFNQGVGYIDKLINSSYIDLNKPVYSLERFTDKFLAVRLFYKPEENYKIVTNIVSTLRRNRV
jgi:hypothetical protein